MLVAAVIALVVANSSLNEAFRAFWQTSVMVGVGDFAGAVVAAGIAGDAESIAGSAAGGIAGSMTLARIINDVLMAIFFLLVGLEVKYELTVGELTSPRQAALPIIAAFGGVLVPVGVYLFITSVLTSGDSEMVSGWGVPTATDIAFALGILALLGNRVPGGVRIFLSTLTVADDIIAILVIALFYGHAPSLGWVACAALVFVLLLVMNRAHVYALAPYMLLGGVLWFCVFMSGVHSTVAGVLVAIAVPSGSRVDVRRFFAWSRERMRRAHATFDAEEPLVKQGAYIAVIESVARVSHQVIPPVARLERRLFPWVYFAVLPLFALTNAGVTVVSGDLATMLASPVTLGVFFGLVVGKPLGIMLFSFLSVKLGVSSLPDGVNWRHLLGSAVLGGVGFTMSIFVANLAFESAALVAQAKLGVLAASLVAGLTGFALLFTQARAGEQRAGEWRAGERREGELPSEGE